MRMIATIIMSSGVLLKAEAELSTLYIPSITPLPLIATSPIVPHMDKMGFD